MVTQKIFIRLAKTDKDTFKTKADINQKTDPLWSGPDVKTRKALPTVHFAIEVNIPDEKFDIEKVAVAKINFELEKERLIVRAVDAL